MAARLYFQLNAFHKEDANDGMRWKPFCRFRSEQEDNNNV